MKYIVCQCFFDLVLLSCSTSVCPNVCKEIVGYDLFGRSCLFPSVVGPNVRKEIDCRGIVHGRK